MKIVPADPSTADVALQESASNVAFTLISTLLSSVEPQRLAAVWKAMSRCWPIVIPGLPPMGAAGVGSLKPSPAPSELITVTVAPPAIRREPEPWAIANEPARAAATWPTAVEYHAMSIGSADRTDSSLMIRAASVAETHWSCGVPSGVV